MQVQALNDVTKRFIVDDGASALADLTDVDVSNPTDGDTLVYDGTNEKWVAQAGGGSGSSVLFVDVGQELDGAGIACVSDYTYQSVKDAIDAGQNVIVILHFLSTMNKPDIYLPLKYITSSEIYFTSVYVNSTISNGTYLYYDNIIFSSSEDYIGYTGSSKKL